MRRRRQGPWVEGRKERPRETEDSIEGGFTEGAGGQGRRGVNGDSVDGATSQVRRTRRRVDQWAPERVGVENGGQARVQVWWGHRRAKGEGNPRGLPGIDGQLVGEVTTQKARAGELLDQRARNGDWISASGKTKVKGWQGHKGANGGNFASGSDLGTEQ